MNAKSRMPKCSDSFFSKEFSQLFSETPNLAPFDFRPSPIITEEGVAHDLAKIKRARDIYHWGSSISVRAFSVKMAYVYAATFYRMRAEKGLDTATQIYTDKLFVHHAYSFFLLYFSYLDHLSQLLYIAFHLKADKPRDVSWGWVCRRLSAAPKSSDLKNIIIEFHGKTEHYRNLRHDFAHNFHPAVPDHRPNYLEEGNELEFPTANHTNIDSLNLMVGSMYDILLKFALRLGETIPVFLAEQRAVSP